MKMTEKEIERINELAKKAKTDEGLTKEEAKEQKELRKAYIESVKANLKAQLDRSYYIDSNGKERKIEKKNKGKKN